MSETRKTYILRLVGRCVVLVLCGLCCAFAPQEFDILNGMNFFSRLSPLHLLWCLWAVDMFLQIVPIKNKVPLGSQKLFKNRFQPIREKINYEALRRYTVETAKGAYKVMLLWCALIGVLAALYFTGCIGKIALFLCTVTFYVCDLICVLIWCPFRLLMKTRCCTTCRIFNWDHLMMFSPLVFAGGFYAVSLFVMAVLAWGIWELFILIYPERFWEHSNVALKCSECTDKLCTQYCQKLRSRPQ